jgi:anti-sigma B factor antagonist
VSVRLKEQDGNIMTDHFDTANSDDLKFDVQIIDVQGHKVLVLSGEIDAYTAPLFKQAVTEILNGDEQHLIMDLQNLNYMDSSGFTILVSAVKRVSPHGGTVNLVGCKLHMDRILRLTKLSSMILLHQNIDDAIKAVYERLN